MRTNKVTVDLDIEIVILSAICLERCGDLSITYNIGKKG